MNQLTNRKTTLSLMLILFSFLQLQAQDMPSIKVGEDRLGVTSLDIKVEVIGNIATTTYDMLFYNPTSSVLEGELAFPLGEGQNVSRLALEVNGKLREAVVVEKEQGRVAFEAVVRQGVDPVLLEKGTGNNYKARIYPIPATGYKRVVLAHEQELILSEDEHYFHLPLGFKKNLDHFALEMNVFNQKLAPSISEGSLANFKFNEMHGNYYAKTVKKNFTPATSLIIRIPQAYENNKTIVSEDYFYVYKRLTPELKQRSKARKIALYWDVSLSVKDRDLNKELQFLDVYLKYLGNVKVELIKFSNAIHLQKRYKIENGEWGDLRQELKHSIYDGGTSYADLFLNEDSDEIILFSDGMKNLSDFPTEIKTPVFVVNGIVKANHEELKSISEATGGKYINLKKGSVVESVEKIKYQAYRFLGAEFSNDALEVYPNTPHSVGKDFSISGKGFNENDKITLFFGYGNKITQSETITIDGEVCNALVERIWGQKKLDVLQFDEKGNKDEIIEHSKLYNLVSNHTSLIVLDSVWDYVRYEITPPNELLDEYNKIMEENKWKKVRTVQKEDVEELVVEGDASNANFVGTISGTISDENGLPMPGVGIVIKGTSNGTQTDFDGNYSIDASTGDILSFSSVGYKSAEADVGASNKISFSMEVDDVAIDEVVITAMGIKRERINPSITYSSQVISGEELNGEPYRGYRSADIMSNQPSSYGTSVGKHKYTGRLKVNTNNNTASYISELSKAKTMKEAYAIYLKQREDYAVIPAYYVDVYDYFKKWNDEEYGLRILTNIAEMDFDNYELLRVLGYKLEEANNYFLASYIYAQVLKLRPEDSQSYRDLALSYEEMGKGEEAFNLLNGIVTGAIYESNGRRQFSGMHTIAKNEINKLVQKEFKGRKGKLKIDNVIDANYDLRIVIDWNHNDTDIDLHVIDPNLEECSYKHTRTKIGGEISDDMTQGFGPEEFTIEKAKSGAYYVKVNYYGDRYQKIENPTFMKVTMFKNYGKYNETKEIKIIRLSKSHDNNIVARIDI